LKLEGVASATQITPSDKAAQQAMIQLTRTTLLPCPSALRRIPHRLHSRSIPARRFIRPHRRIGTAVDAFVEVNTLPSLAELQTISIHPLDPVAAVRDVEGTGVGGDGADRPVHAGGVINFRGVETVAVSVVACERHIGVGGGSGEVLERDVSGCEDKTGAKTRESRCLVSGVSSVLRCGLRKDFVVFSAAEVATTLCQ
jgi:hypothetical protein